MISILGEILGLAMRLCYSLLQNYGLAIILFVLISKVLLLPISIWVHNNGIKLVKMQPEINFLKAEHYGDYDFIAEEQSKIFKRAKYNPLASLIPLVIQIILLMGIVEVIYNPLTYILKLPSDIISSLIALTGELTGADTASNSIQLLVLSTVKDNPNAFLFLGDILPAINISSVLDSIAKIDMKFLGLDLSWIPYQVKGITLVVPFIAAFSSWLQCYTQNKSAVLQSEQGKLNKYGTMAFSVGLSLYLGWFVPVGVALYWISSILLAIVQMYILNYVINPKKYIDYEKLNESRKILSDIESLEIKKRKWYQKDPNKKREKADYKRFFSVANKHLVFYSEKSGFYKYFKNIIEYLLSHSNVIIHYVTNDPDDAIFKLAIQQPRIRPYYIGVKKTITLMMKMDADIVVMTTPDLQNYYIKRSYLRKDIEYIYVFHGLASTNMVVRKGAYDHFDTILCVGQHQIDELKESEEMYNLPAKNLVPCGYGLMDDLIASYEKMGNTVNETNVILIAPSWQPDNILDSCIDTMLDSLFQTNYCIIVRPHPEYIKRFPAKMERLISKYKDKIGNNFNIETDFSSNTSIFSADILITDWSGIAFEFSFTTKRPSLFIDTPMKVLNPDYVKYKNQPLDISLRNQVGISIKPDEVDKVCNIVHNLISEKKSYVEKIEQVRSKYIYNIGESGRFGAEYILSKLIRKK
ncbi:MAG: membrane protein insertase YidC [Acetivibrionales bacterium]|jgi:YidC/Oxa1 family membrane protein insertase